MQVVCINDNGRPNEVPPSKWVKKDEIYTVIRVMKLNVQGGIYGFELAEIDLKGCCSPYEYFAASRFAPIVGPKEVVEEQLEELTV